MRPVYDVVVAGAGLTGIACALLLARSKAAESFRIRVIDRRAEPAMPSGYGLRVSAIAPGSRSVLEQAGAWQRLPAELAGSFETMRIWDAAEDPDGPSTLRFDAAELALRSLGDIVDNVALEVALLEAARDSGVEFEYSTTIRDATSDASERCIRLADGSERRADLLVAADGARSRLRELHGIAAVSKPYEQTAFVTHLQPDIDHGRCAQQRFLADGPLGILPLADGRVSVVWSTKPETAKWAMAADDEELGRRLTKLADGVLGQLTVDGPRGSFPLTAIHANRYVAGSTVLVGDAAHAIHPLAGQGVNLGLQDAATLADVLESGIQRGEHPADRPVLRRYERARRGANAGMLHLLTGLDALFRSDSRLVKELRRSGMRLFSASGLLRERAAAVALGAASSGPTLR